jgi:threonine/homoserine efflux transporter RhtA
MNINKVLNNKWTGILATFYTLYFLWSLFLNSVCLMFLSLDTRPVTFQNVLASLPFAFSKGLYLCGNYTGSTAVAIDIANKTYTGLFFVALAILGIVLFRKLRRKNKKANK